MIEVVNGVRLTPSHYTVHRWIKILSKKDGWCYASNETIGMKAHLSKWRVSHIISDLQEASLLARYIDYARAKDGEYVRQLRAFDEPIEEDAMQKYLEKARTSWDEEQIKLRLIHNARALGINIMEVMNAYYEYGTKRVEEVLAMVKSRYSGIRSTTAWFKAALRDGYKATERAIKQAAKVYKPLRKWHTADPVRDIAYAKETATQDAERAKGTDFMNLLNNICPMGRKRAALNS